MNKEICVMCAEMMGNSLHKVRGHNCHVRCEGAFIAEQDALHENDEVKQ